MNMKSLRISALILALGAFSICSIPAHAQQEVDPDHFDQPSVVSTHIQGSKTQSHHSAAVAQLRSNKKLASAHAHKTQHSQRS
jgi:hypothetical protein